MTLVDDPPTHTALAYSGGWLDRGGALRRDPALVEAALRRADATVVPMWQTDCLVRGGPSEPVMLPAGNAAAVLAAADECVFLGLDAGAPVFAADLSSSSRQRSIELAGAAAAVDVRQLAGAIDAKTAAVLAYARGLLYWHRNQQYCGGCGSTTDNRDGGLVRRCRGDGCGRLLFPRIEPAVIVLVESPGPPARCLMARHRGAPEGAYSTLAGFVEVGESLEDTVRREVAEEVGVRVGAVTYQGSQAWPFSAGLMVGFRAQAEADTVAVDRDEIEEARWFTRAELRAQAARHRMWRPDSIGRFLAESWHDEQPPD
ncbi:MAG TPA: NAD(+) diphosphatase [Micromonosporaceae bacterium]|nr:NAD(+) diphosphatase [Micromonosporaceae bacterium]